jgi:hypothetical protein
MLFGALALVCALLGALGMHSGSRGTLRTYVAGLQSKGEKLTYDDLMRGRGTNTFDSHAVLTNAASKLNTARGLHPSLLDLRIYVRPGEARATWKQSDPVWSQSSGAAGEATWDDLATQLQAFHGAFQEVREALKTPAADAGPFTNVHTTRRVEFVAIRTVAQWLMGAAENDLHQGNLEAALQNIEALAGLAYMERDEPTLVAQMIRVAVANLALTVTWEALQAPGWTEPQLERLQNAWAPVDLLDAVQKGFEGERVGGYEIFGMVRHSNGARMRWLFGRSGSATASSSGLRLDELMMECVYLPAYKLTSIDEDELFYLRNMEQGITGVRLLKTQRPWAEAKQRVDLVLTNIYAMSSSFQKFRYLLSMITLPNYSRACETAVHGETERQMTLAAIALKRFQLRHGQLPPNLEALVPEFLPAVPYDYMGARPISYRLKADGHYVLYSVGDDGKDDGGDPTPLPGGRFGLWTGQDAVWPSPDGKSSAGSNL